VHPLRLGREAERAGDRVPDRGRGLAREHDHPPAHEQGPGDHLARRGGAPRAGRAGSPPRRPGSAPGRARGRRAPRRTPRPPRTASRVSASMPMAVRRSTSGRAAAKASSSGSTRCPDPGRSGPAAPPGPT
jgi:hypothetical protein